MPRTPRMVVSKKPLNYFMVRRQLDVAFAQITPLVRKRRHDATAHRERRKTKGGCILPGFSKDDTNEWASYPFHSS
jgi:hypothetical protein